MKILLVSVFFGFVLDFFGGDPSWIPHPICAIGRLISFLEKKLLSLSLKKESHKLYTGTVLTLVVCLVCFFVPYALLWLAFSVDWRLGFALQTFWAWQIFATRSLKIESMKVYYALKNKSLSESRKMLSYIVGRDTSALTEPQIIRATVETVAENTTDGVVSPLIFMLLGGVPLAFLYKAVNTLDSMVGYKNDTYLYFGRVSARLDDVFNFIPAIFSAYMMMGAAFFLRLDVKNAFAMYRRDRYAHKSPNSGKTECACAGALGIQLGGSALYFGKMVEKATLGDALREATIEDIPLTCRLLYVTVILSFILLWGACVFWIF